MAVVFADAGYFIANLDERDELHAQATAVAGQLAPLRIVTTEMVLVEVLNYYSGAGEHQKELAAQMALNLVRNPNVEIVPQTTTQFRAALARYQSRKDQTWSLTDCVSFMAMEERGINEALAYDRDFEQAGFVALLRNPSA